MKNEKNNYHSGQKRSIFKSIKVHIDKNVSLYILCVREAGWPHDWNQRNLGKSSGPVTY